MALSRILQRFALALTLATISPLAHGQVAFWQHFLGGSAYDAGEKLLLLPDGTMVIGGDVFSTDGLAEGNHSEEGDIAVFKYTTQESILWKRILGGSGTEQLHDLILTSDGGYALIGVSNSGDGDVPKNAGGDDVWAVKLNSRGETVWSRSWGGRGDDQGTAIIELPDGGFLIGGESSSYTGDMKSPHHGALDSWIAKLDAQGKLIWEKHYGGSQNDMVSRLHLISADRYLVINASDSHDGDLRYNLGKKDVWVFTINGVGEIDWQQNYGGEANDAIHDSYIDPANNLIMAGTTFSSGGQIPKHRGQGDFWALSIKLNGQLNWSNTYGGPRPDGLNAVTTTYDGGYVFAGMTKSRDQDIELNRGYYDGWLLKTDARGERIWSRTMGFEGKDALTDILELPEGGFLALGFSFLPPAGTGARLPGHSGMADIWLVNFGDPDRSGVRPYITPAVLFGTVVSSATGEPLKAEITLTDNTSLDSLTSVASDAEGGRFAMLLPAYGLVSISVLTRGYMLHGEDIAMDTVVRKTLLKKEIRLDPIRIGSSLVLDYIYFHTGKWNLLPQSNAELERVVAFLDLNPRVQIQVSGHTDNTGNKKEKQQLSLNRANAVKKYLVSKGIAPNRLRVKGYGMYRPVATNVTPQGRRKNRRVEFEVVNK